MHYVIGDVHGCYDEMLDLLKQIESEDANARIIFVGDFIDRGFQVDKVLDWCLDNITSDGKYQSVRGNHEQLALEWYERWMQWWRYYGSKSYMGVLMPESDYDFSKWMDGMHKLTPESLQPYMEFFKSLPFNKKVTVQTTFGLEQTYRIVHASYDYGEDVFDEAQEYINLWWRGEGNGIVTDEIIVHGHTPTITPEYTAQVHDHSLPGMICYRENDINVDGGCVYSSAYPGYPTFLCAICLENLKEIYSCSLEERYLRKTGEADIAMKNCEIYKRIYFREESECRRRLLKKIGF